MGDMGTNGDKLYILYGFIGGQEIANPAYWGTYH